jgi:hypothetical protein
MNKGGSWWLFIEPSNIAIANVAWIEPAESGISWFRFPVLRYTSYGLLATCYGNEMLDGVATFWDGLDEQRRELVAVHWIVDHSYS